MVVFGHILSARRPVNSAEVRVPAVRAIDDWFFALSRSLPRQSFPEFVWVTLLGKSKDEIRYQQWLNWRDSAVEAHMVPARGECLGISFLCRNFDSLYSDIRLEVSKRLVSQVRGGLRNFTCPFLLPTLYPPSCQFSSLYRG